MTAAGFQGRGGGSLNKGAVKKERSGREDRKVLEDGNCQDLVKREL